jgi:hypothetical protein
VEFISPHHLAYDRPSVKFLNFLKKYYGLESYIPQANNFVIFQDYGLQYLELGNDSSHRPKGKAKERQYFKISDQTAQERSLGIETTEREGKLACI